jgi:hypothetical protein
MEEFNVTSDLKRAVKGLARGLGFEIKNLSGIPKTKLLPGRTSKDQCPRTR